MRQKRPPDKDKLYWELDLDDLFRRLKEGMGRLFIPKGKKRKPNPMEDRRVFVGYPPEYSMVSFVIGAVITGVMGLLSLLYATWIPLICAGMLWIPLGLLCLLGGYEIRYDGSFDNMLGRRSPPCGRAAKWFLSTASGCSWIAG